MTYDDTSDDAWSPIWGDKYTSRRFYAHVFSGVEAHPYYKKIWTSNCTPRVKFFAWLVLVDRLNTKTMLCRRHLNTKDDTLCFMCSNGIEEDIDHLLFECPFAGQCWSSINFVWDTSLPLTERFTQAEDVHGLEFFIEASLIATWELWKLHNDKIF